MAQAPQAFVFVGAGTARGEAQAPQARQIIGCRHPRGPFEVGAGPAWRGAGTAGTSNNSVQASAVHRELGAGTAGIGFYLRRHATPFGVIKLYV